MSTGHHCLVNDGIYNVFILQFNSVIRNLVIFCNLNCLSVPMVALGGSHLMWYWWAMPCTFLRLTTRVMCRMVWDVLLLIVVLS